MSDNNTETSKKNNIGRVALIVSAVLFVLAVAAFFIYQKGYYGTRWYKGTSINGVDVSNKTLDESKEILNDAIEDYSCTVIARDNGRLTILGDNIDFQCSISSDFEREFGEQHKNLQIFTKPSDHSIKYDVQYNESKLEEIVSKSELITGSNFYKIRKPKSAKVVYSSESMRYEIKPEKPGNKLIKKKFLRALKENLSEARKEMDISDEENRLKVYREPKVVSDDEQLGKTLEAYNSAAIRFISWNMGNDVTESITPEEISDWISYENGSIKYDDNAVAKWVEKFCLKYKTVGKTRQVISHTGKAVTVKGGDYGWQMDYNTILEQAKSGLTKKIKKSKVKAYLENPNDETIKEVTVKKKPKYLNEAFQKDYENFAVDWDENNYIEVSLADQMVYVFKNGKVKFSCRCISGRPVPGRTTPTGAYYIKEHREAYTLTGADYSTDVKNWVRITWSGTGFHPATWQPWSRWSKTLYQTRGSHGCINLEPSDAEKIYKLTSYREAVFIY